MSKVQHSKPRWKNHVHVYSQVCAICKGVPISAEYEHAGILRWDHGAFMAEKGSQPMNSNYPEWFIITIVKFVKFMFHKFTHSCGRTLIYQLWSLFCFDIGIRSLVVTFIVFESWLLEFAIFWCSICYMINFFTFSEEFLNYMLNFHNCLRFCKEYELTWHTILRGFDSVIAWL